MPSSHVFELEELKKVRRLASMVTAEFIVRFKPAQMIDYQHTITLSAENDSFLIYVLGMLFNLIRDYEEARMVK